MSLPSEVCYYCEKPDPDLHCILECKRSFHKQCLRLRAWEEISGSEIYCENCLLRIVRDRNHLASVLILWDPFSDKHGLLQVFGAGLQQILP